MENHKNEFDRYCYQVRIRGYLDESWAIWLDCATITHEITEDNHLDVTILTFPVTDQPALRGLLNRLFDLNMTILSLKMCNPNTDTNNI